MSTHLPALGTKINTKNHPPHAKLISYMKKKSQLERAKSTLEMRGETKKLTLNEKNKLDDISKKLLSLKNKKTEVLDDIIFPSMANMIFFFESISESAELQETFESHIRELFGIRRLQPRPWNYAYYFKTLINTMMSTKREFENNDFRIKLIYEIQKLLESKFQQISTGKFGTTAAFKHVNQDMSRVVAWSELIATQIRDEYDFDNPVYYGVPKPIPKEYLNDESKKNRYKENIQKLRELEWDKFCAESNKPHRTMEFDTKKLIDESDSEHSTI